MDDNGKLPSNDVTMPAAAETSAPATTTDGPGEPAAELRRGLAGMVRGGDVHLEQSAAVVSTARGGSELHQSATVAMVSGGDTTVRLGAAVIAPTLGDVSIEKGGAQWVIAAGDVSFDKGGCAAVVAPAVRVENGAVGVALARKVEVGEGGRVVLGPLGAAALGIGFGVAFGATAVALGAWAGWRAWKRLPKVWPFK